MRRYRPSCEPPRDNRTRAATAVVFTDDHACYVTDPYAKRRHVLAARVNWRLALALIWLVMVAAVISIGPLLIMFSHHGR